MYVIKKVLLIKMSHNLKRYEFRACVFVCRFPFYPKNEQEENTKFINKK